MPFELLYFAVIHRPRKFSTAVIELVKVNPMAKPFRRPRPSAHGCRSLQSRPPEYGPGRFHPKAASGQGCIDVLLLAAVEYGGVTFVGGAFPSQLNAISRRLNERPRKTLEFHTMAEMFNRCVALTRRIRR